MRRPHPGGARWGRGAGFSLIEVLIALVVLSVGLLGLAALQAEGLRSSSTAFQRTQAVLLASDLMDRMRANRAGLGFFKGAAVDPGDAASQGCSDSGHAGTAVAAVSCSGAEMAEHSVFEWAQTLPEGYSALIEEVAGATNQFTLTVQWTDRSLVVEGEEGSGMQQYQADVQF